MSRARYPGQKLLRWRIFTRLDSTCQFYEKHQSNKTLFGTIQTQNLVVQDVDADVLQKYDLAQRFQDVNLPVLSKRENIIDQVSSLHKLLMLPLLVNVAIHIRSERMQWLWSLARPDVEKPPWFHNSFFKIVSCNGQVFFKSLYLSWATLCVLSGARIVVTQPRRIAAQSVARRVADNLGVRLYFQLDMNILETQTIFFSHLVYHINAKSRVLDWVP